MKKESESMEFTGERFVPEVHGNIELEHLHRYLLACKAVAGKTVLDIASGEGYGSAMLARTAHKVTGVDISQEAISHAQAKYQAENLEFHLGSCSAIPLGDASVDVVVSFETIEHHGEHEAMMREIKRVLRPGGVLVISSPDKLEYSDKPGYSNPHHVKELFTDEFECLLKKFFGNVQMLGQRVVYGSLVVPQEPTSHYSLKSITTENEKAGLSSPIYDVAVASDTMLPELYGSLFEMLIDGVDAASYLTNAIVQRDALIDNLGKTIESIVIDRDSHKAGVAQLQVSFEKLSHERDEQVSNLYRVVADRDALVANLGQTVESLVIDRDSHKAGVEQLQGSFEKLARERDEQVSQLNRVVAERDNQLEKFKAELSAVYKSKSWHLTSPLRWLVRKITRTDSSVVSDSYECPQMKLSQDQQPLANVENEANVPTEKTDPKFRILLVSYYCPTRAHAGGLRILDIYALIRHQCPNVQIDLLTYHRPSIDWSLDDVHRIFHNVYLSPTEDLTPEVLLSLRGSPLRYDVIDLQFHQSGYQIDAFRRIGSKIIFTPMESLAKVALINLRTNFLTISSSRLLKMAASLRLAAEEVVFALKADEVVCVSRADAAILRAVTSSRRVHGMDTGVSQFEFAEALAPSFVCASAESRRCNVLYLAYFGSETNVSALRWYLDKVHPIIKASVPGYVLTVVGRGDLSAFSSYRDDSIAFVGEVAALAPSIQEARIGIAPALAGSGLRGKVNQYAILGVPSVVSPIAHKGLVYQDGENIFVAEKPEVFAERCIRLLTDLELNDRMGQAARELCLATYSWQSKWPTIRKIYNLGKEDVLHVAS